MDLKVAAMLHPPAPPKVTSLTDPTAAWTNKGQRKVGFAYGANYLIDLQRAIIVDVEATPARWSAEVAATKTVLERTRQCFGLNPQRLAADAAYGSGLMIGWLMRRRVEPHIPAIFRSRVSSSRWTLVKRVSGLDQALQIGKRHPTAAHRLITPNFPASWENTGNFAYFACWKQPKGTESQKDYSVTKEFPEPSNREISGPIRELNWRIRYCLARSFHWRYLAFVLKENELWLVIKALVVNQTQPSGAIFDAANMAIADCLALPMIFATRSVV
jgi:hypothetical protein